MKRPKERRRGYNAVLSISSYAKRKKDSIVLRNGVEIRDDLMGKEITSQYFSGHNKMRN